MMDICLRINKREGFDMKYLKYIVTIIAILVCIIIFGLNIIYMSDVCDSWQEIVSISYFGIGNLLITILIATGLIKIINWIEQKREKNEKKISSKKKYIIIGLALLVYIIIGIIWVVLRDSTPIADSMRVYEAATDIFKGRNLTNVRYFELNPQNLSISFFFSLLFTVFHSNSLWIIKIANIIANCFTIIGLFLITKLLKKDYDINETKSLVLSLTYIPIILLVNFIYGDIISLPFSVFSIYFTMKYGKENKVYHLLISAFLMMIAVILRMNNLILVIASILYLILNLQIKDKSLDKKEKAKKIGIKLTLMIVFIIISLVPSKIATATLQNQYDLDKKREIPATRYIAMGMQEGTRANGWYNSETGDIAHTEKKINHEQYSDMIKERLTYFSNHILYTIKFYVKKVASMWTEPLQESIWQNLSFNFESLKKNKKFSKAEIASLEKMDAKILNNEKIMQLYLKAIIFIIFGTVILFIIQNRKQISNEAILLLLVFLGGFFFHILWEGKSRYIIPYLIILIPLASIKIKEVKIKKILAK